MRFCASNVLFAALTVGQDCQQIALSTACHKQTGFLPEQLCGLRFEAVDRWIITVDIVSDRRFGHGLAHTRRRSSYCVAAQVDNFAHKKTSWGLPRWMLSVMSALK